MKKSLALMLILVLLLSLCACGDTQKAPDPLVGSWTLAGLDLGGEDYTSLVSMFDIRLSFEPDGTGSMFSAGEELPLTWRSGSFSDGTDTYSYTIENDILRFETEGMVFLFHRG